MTLPVGQTRTRIAARHALIAPDGHVKSTVPGISGAATIILINPTMGARFAQLLVTFETGGRASMPENDVETVGYFETGGGWVTIGRNKARVLLGGYFFAPAGKGWSITSPEPGTRVTLFQKKFVPLAGTAAPKPIVAHSAEVKGEPFLGDPNALLQVLLPDEVAFDLAVNIFTFQPGAKLPFVETHVMEHGLLMLKGQGEYRLEEESYSVAAGDVIWMASFCPQWFVAKGKIPSSYLYYKDVNRPAL
jgi:(S)-ureidoglycine aminohydrolase